MKPTYKIFSIYMLVIVIMLLLATSCNPVKQVLRDKEKFEQVAREVVKAGFCVNDTVTVTKDTTIYTTKDSVIFQTDTVNTKCPDFTRTFKDGTVVESKNGNISVKTIQKTITKTVTITVTNNVRDKKLESILREERDQALDKAAKLQSKYEDIQKELKDKKRTLTYIYIGLTALVLFFIGLKTGILKKFIPFI